MSFTLTHFIAGAWDRLRSSCGLRPSERQLDPPVCHPVQGAIVLLTRALAEGTAGGASAAAAGRAFRVPRTLARAAVVGAQPLPVPRRIDFVGVHWRGTLRDGGSVRFRRDRAWTAWQQLHAGEIHPRGRVASELVPAGRATAYQVRAPRGGTRCAWGGDQHHRWSA